jgi:hypothetical protein
MRRAGVVGVFWGAKHPRRGGRGHLRVHVREKIAPAALPANRRIARHIQGLPTCVVAAGEPEAHMLTLKGLAHPAGDAARNSTLTTLVREADGWFALLSGHGTLPIEGGALATSLPDSAASYPVVVHDVSSGTDLAGSLIAGRIGGSFDFAIARVEPLDEPLDLVCPATESQRPPVRTAAVDRDEPVVQFSCRDRTLRSGTVTGFGQVRLTFDDGNPYLFTSVLEVHGTRDPFSCRGDSGSLVADRHGRAIGVVIGGSKPEDGADPASYVLPFVSPGGGVPAALQRFFS